MYFFDLGDLVTANRRIPLHFNCSGFFNGKQSWLSDDSTLKLIWDTTLAQPAWRVSGATIGDIQLINTNPASPPVNGNWTVIGQAYTVSASSGACPVADELLMTTSVTKAGCSCDGTITIQASGGYPPYLYSLSPVPSAYRASPFFNKVCGVTGGIITAYVQDTYGTVVSQTVNIGSGGQPTTHTINQTLVTNERVSYNPTTKYASYKSVYRINVTEGFLSGPMTNSMVITFDLTVTGRFRRSPYINSASSTLTHTVTKNGTPISTTFINGDTETNVPGTGALTTCASYSSYYTNYSRTYPSVTYQKDDVIEVTTYFDVTPSCNSTPAAASLILENENVEGGDSLGPLTYGKAAAYSYVNCCVYNWEFPPYVSTDNPKITGCNCCEVKIGTTYTKSLYE